MFGFRPEDLLIVFIIALFIFGPKKLPEIGRGIGQSIQQFKKGMDEVPPSQEEKPPVETAKNEHETAEHK